MNNNIPFQVQQIIQGLLNTSDSVYLRGNYRMRLIAIRDEIDKAITKYDNETLMAGKSKRREVQ